jgi:pheromone shutdown protein TraB
MADNDNKIYDTNYNKYIDILGTAHFTTQSINDAIEKVQTIKPDALALELDLRRYFTLQGKCIYCGKRHLSSKCEFTTASDALGNVDADIWLVDMTEEEIHQQIMLLAQRYGFIYRPINHWASYHEALTAARLWESGRKEEAQELFDAELEQLKQSIPIVWAVLVEERNLLMAARLSWLVTGYLDERIKEPKVLVLTGAAHEKGMKQYLEEPTKIPDKLREFNLNFTKPSLIRRVHVV